MSRAKPYLKSVAVVVTVVLVFQAVGVPGFFDDTATRSTHTCANTRAVESGGNGAIIDSAEDSDLSEYVGATSSYATTTNRSYDRSTSITTTSQARIVSTSGLRNYFEQGEMVTFRTCVSTDEHAQFLFGVQNDSGTSGYFYSFLVAPDSDVIRLELHRGASETTLKSVDTARSIDNDRWLKGRIIWYDNGTIAATLFDEAGGKIDTAIVRNTTYTSGGVGFETTVNRGSGEAVNYDGIYKRPRPVYDLSRHVVDTKEADGSKPVDLDGDGDLDIVSAEGQSGVNWFENDGTGSFSRERDVMTNAFSNSVEGVNAFDFDGDGKQSVFAVSNGGGKIEMTEATASDVSSWRKNVTIKSGVFGIQKTSLSDIDRDGDMDIAYAWEGGSMESGGYGWLEFTGGDPLDTRNWDDHAIAQIEGAWWLTSPIDIDGDGDEDFVGTVRENLNPAANGRLVWLERPTDPTATWTVHTIDDTTGFVPNNAELADFDGDGTTDIAAAMYDNGTGIYWYDTDEGFTRTAIVKTRTWYGLGAADFTGNGRAELVAVERDVTPTNGDRDTIIFYEYIEGEWRARRSKLFGKSDDRVSVVDIDGAGDYDVLTGSQAAGTVWWEVTNLDNGLKRPNSRSRQSTNLSDVLERYHESNHRQIAPAG